MGNSVKTWHIVNKTALSKVGSLANEELDNTLALIDDKLNDILDIIISGDVLTIESSTKQRLKSNGSDGTTGTYNIRLPLIGGKNITIAQSTLDLTNGATTGDFIQNPYIGVTVGASKYIQMGIEVRSDGKLYIVWGTENAVESSATTPPFSVSNSIPLHIIKLRNDGSAGAWNFITPTEDKIYKLLLVSGTGNGPVSGFGNITTDSGACTFPDTFVDTNALDYSAGKTTATLDGSLEVMGLNYDSRRTATSIGTSITINATPGYIAAAGDVIRAQGQVRSIITVISQVQYVLSAAFLPDLTNTSCCISQSVYTKDLMNLIKSGEENISLADDVGTIVLSGKSVNTYNFASQPWWLTPAVNDIVLQLNGGTLYESYVSSLGSGTIILNSGTNINNGLARIIRPMNSYSITYWDNGLNNTSTVSFQAATNVTPTWDTESINTRVIGEGQTAQTKSIAGTAGAHFYARFFANKTTTNDTGTVKLYYYTARFYTAPLTAIEKKIGIERYFGADFSTGADYINWATLMTACNPGDTIIVMPGTYNPTANYTVNKAVRIIITKGAIINGTAASTKGFDATTSDVVFEIYGKIQGWSTSGDFAIYFESGASRGKVIGSGIFSTNDKDVYTQFDTISDPALSSI